MSRLRLIRHALSICTISIILLSCGGGGSEPVAPDNDARQRQLAQAFLSEVIGIMRNNALTRNEIDFGNLEAEVDELAADANSISDTYPAITRALELLNTNHSFLLSPSGALITYPSTISCEQDLDIDMPDIPGVGYVRVDRVSTRNDEEAQEIALTIHNSIAQQDSPNITGWIVDLRDNLGGNVWPMIAGLGPLFNDTRLGYFVRPDGNAFFWGYRNGSSYLGDNNIVTIDQPYTLINPAPKIAVLVSARTASSGEATLIAFKKQFNVRLFGTDSCGLSTANTSFTLLDNSTLLLTTSVIADREQEEYGSRVPVDQVTSPDNTLAEAIAWLQN